VAGLIDAVRPVAEIIDATMAGFYATINRLSALSPEEQA
jgi:hypothetical protein